MDDLPPKGSTTEYLDWVRNSLIGKRIIKVLLPSPDEPFDEFEMILDDGSRVMVSVSSDDGSGVIAWGLNVPGADDGYLK